MENKIETKFKAKAKDSFKTKINLFIFSLVIEKRVSFTVEDFHNFKITNDLVTLFSAEYWQLPRKSNINNMSIDDIYKQILKLKEDNKDIINILKPEYINLFSTIFPENEFEKLLSVKQCHYCKVTNVEIYKLAEKHQLFSKNERGRSLEIDRRNSNYEYTPDNCVMACYWCNNAKTDEFTMDEFKEIGDIIGNIWKKRLE